MLNSSISVLDSPYIQVIKPMPIMPPRSGTGSMMLNLSTINLGEYIKELKLEKTVQRLVSLLYPPMLLYLLQVLLLCIIL